MPDFEDRFSITQVVQQWAIARDTGDWESLRGTFHPDGTMTATWFTGSADDFVARATESHRKGSRGAHFMGGTFVKLNGAKAIAESRMMLLQRGTVEGVDVDVTCNGRFYDRFVRHDGRWCILERQCIYEKDRIDPLVPGTPLRLDRALLERFPEGYRHVAYMQTKAGMTVAPDRPTPRSAELERLYAGGKAWLETR
jgi:hypothetical protein